LRDVFVAKKRSIGATAECAMLNVGAAKEAASRYADVSVILNAEPIDKSHSLVTGYADALNDQVAEQLQTAISARYPARAAKSQS
jgi:hypothetical protein